MLNPGAVAAGALAALVVFHRVGWLAPLESGTVRILRPVQQVLVTAGTAVGAVWGDRRGQGQVRQENRQLREQVQRLAIDNQRLQQRVSELALLQEQENFLDQRQLSAVAARVIGRELSAEAQVIVLDRGQRLGVRVGLPVIVNNGVLIGRVVEVGAELSKVMLLTDGRSVTPAAIDGDPSVQGVVSGQFGVSLRLDLVPKDTPLHAGDLIVTTDHEGDLPRGLLIGSVSRVETGATPFFHVAFLQPFVPYQSLRVAAVLLPR